MTCAQAEAKYTKLLEDTQRQLESLEASVRAAPNTKTDIKTVTRSLGICFRDFLSIAKKIGITKTPDTTEQRLQGLQPQQQQQHAVTMKLINEICEVQLKTESLLQN